MALETELLTVSPMRAAIARRMQASKQEIPHFYLSAEIRMDAALDERRISERVRATLLA